MVSNASKNLHALHNTLPVALLQYTDEPSSTQNECLPVIARTQVAAAVQYLSVGHYKLAQQYAGSSQMYLRGCKEEDRIERIDGDATLTMAKAMFARGNSDGTKNAYGAAHDYLQCSVPENYPNDYEWCRKKYQEAKRLAPKEFYL